MNVEDKTDVVNLHQLETTPDLIFKEIVSKLDPKSLIKLCSTSKLIRKRCDYMWKILYKRDISTDKLPCKNPNWRRLYSLALSKTLPVYEIEIYRYGFKEGSNDREDKGKELESMVVIGEKQAYREVRINLASILYVRDTKLEKYLGLVKKNGDAIIEPGDIEGSGPPISYHLYLNYLGNVPIVELLNSRGQKMYMITISSGEYLAVYFAVGLKNLITTVEIALDKLNIDEEEMYPLIRDIKDESVDVFMSPSPYMVYSDNDYTSTQVYISDCGIYEEEFEDVIKDICEM